MNGLKFGLFFLAGLLVLDARTYANDNLMAKVESGELHGDKIAGISVFRGIPYAAPPTGDLRWRPPQAPLKWEGVKDATAFGPSCPQSLDSPTFLAGPLKRVDEDCLTLNIWAPAKTSGRHFPVMVWIHGGGFFTGSGSEAQFDGMPYADRGVILVTINYRIGRLGFFAHPALVKESPDGLVGNYGYTDMIAALKWVRRNIGAFGGDPGNVTVFGESAGAMAVNALLTSPLAHGLFEKAIIESGPASLSPRHMTGDGANGAPTAMALGTAFAEKHGIRGDDAAAAAALRALPVEAVAPTKPTMGDIQDIMSSVGPMIDGKLLPRSPLDAAANNGMPRIPIIIGNNSLESRVWSFGGTAPTTIPIVPGTSNQILDALGPDRDAVLAAYRPLYGDDIDKLAAFIAADRFMGAGTRLEAALLAKSGSLVYAYRFSALPSPVRDAAWGTPHGTEIYYVFGSLSKMRGVGDRMTDADRALSRAVIDYWTSFAKTGNPNAPGLPQWPTYSRARDKIVEFDDGGPKVVSPPNAAGLSLLEARLVRAH